MTNTNTGRRDAKGRVIWAGPRGGLFVRGRDGKRLKPAVKSAAVTGRTARGPRAPSRMCTVLKRIKIALPQWRTRLRTIVQQSQELAHRPEYVRRPDDEAIQSLFFQLDDFWDQTLQAGFDWAAYDRRDPQTMALAEQFVEIAKDGVTEAEHYCI